MRHVGPIIVLHNLNADCLKNYDWRETTKQVDYGYTTLDQLDSFLKTVIGTMRDAIHLGMS